MSNIKEYTEEEKRQIEQEALELKAKWEKDFRRRALKRGSNFTPPKKVRK